MRFNNIKIYWHLLIFICYWFCLLILRMIYHPRITVQVIVVILQFHQTLLMNCCSWYVIERTAALCTLTVCTWYLLQLCRSFYSCLACLLCTLYLWGISILWSLFSIGTLEKKNMFYIIPWLCLSLPQSKCSKSQKPPKTKKQKVNASNKSWVKIRMKDGHKMI